MQENESKKNESKKNKNDEILDKENDGIPDDWLGTHKIFTRLIIIAITWAFIYSVWVPLAIGYVEIISYVLLFALMVITFGLNSLKLMGILIEKWKK